MQNKTLKCSRLFTALHVKFRLVVSGKAAPELLIGLRTIIADSISLVGLVKGREPEEIETPVERAAESLVPVGFLVLVTCLGCTRIVTAVTRPASLCDKGQFEST